MKGRRSPVLEGVTEPQGAARGFRRRTAFSLVELTVVVMIIAILGAIAATRMSRFAGDAEQGATAATVGQLQKAIDSYHAEHGGSYPAAAMLGPQLTQFTDDAGNPSPTRSGGFQFGPYLKAMPPLYPGPAGTALLWKGDAAAARWVYVEATGEVRETK